MKGYFFNAQPTDDAIAHPSGWDREYDAADYNACMGAFYENGVFANRDPDACKVTASGLTLFITPGVALVTGGQCHFEPGDSVTLANGDGKYSIMCRKNNTAEVRGFQLLALHHATEFPAPVRAGDLYDLCLAHVTVTGGAVSILDTRSDAALCGFAALTAMPPYYPPDSDNLPYVLWLYTLGFPMTPEQISAVEGNPSLMSIVNASKTRPASTEEAALGVDNIHPITPKTAYRKKRMISEIFESAQWVCPSGVTKLDVWIVGGGQAGTGGNPSTNQGGNGGAGGECLLVENISVTPGMQYEIIVGAGGAATGSAGGDSSAFGFTAKGGSDITGTPGGKYIKSQYASSPGCNGQNGVLNPYDNILYGCSGGAGSLDSKSRGGGANKSSATRGLGGNGAYVPSNATISDSTGEDGQVGGGGGGGGASRYSEYRQGVGGKGGNGIVIVYA